MNDFLSEKWIIQKSIKFKQIWHFKVFAIWQKYFAMKHFKSFKCVSENFMQKLMITRSYGNLIKTFLKQLILKGLLKHVRKIENF